LEQRLNVDLSDEPGSPVDCGCGKLARYESVITVATESP
jgi:hypothetical protein